MPYRTLDKDRIIATAALLEKRIGERLAYWRTLFEGSQGAGK